MFSKLWDLTNCLRPAVAMKVNEATLSRAVGGWLLGGDDGRGLGAAAAADLVSSMAAEEPDRFSGAPFWGEERSSGARLSEARLASRFFRMGRGRLFLLLSAAVSVGLGYCGRGGGLLLGC